MTGLTSVKLPLALANNSGLDSGAFQGCTNNDFNTIEFDFTTASGKNLGEDNLGESNDSAVTALTNIYKMFAASDNSFGDNGSSGIQAPTAGNL